jgi:hypothetical protein
LLLESLLGVTFFFPFLFPLLVFAQTERKKLTLDEAKKDELTIKSSAEDKREENVAEMEKRFKYCQSCRVPKR